MRMRRARGFTLAEVVIAIGIAGLLVEMVFCSVVYIGRVSMGIWSEVCAVGVAKMVMEDVMSRDFEDMEGFVGDVDGYRCRCIVEGAGDRREVTVRVEYLGGEVELYCERHDYRGEG